ncbi:MAG TPA: carboxylesterase family protein [Phenylobacterium sp.]|nr:carboxylesterase family protein [Phenylobacterium sp.]
MTFRLLLLALAALSIGAPGGWAASGEPPTVRVAQGEARGVAEDGVAVFKGLPYAAPPVGPLRWRPPQAPRKWTGLRDAAAFGPDCVQKRGGWDPTQSKLPVSEDCLTLNVWAPAAKGPARPVMVWIHGGGFTMGSGSQPLFDGAKLARRGIVVVTLNYRLGRFGFFAHPALAAENPGAATGNYGLMDQVAALQWVRRNIAAFGGDPAKVTIFGESAGGGSVIQLMLMAPARGLFRAAAAESGGGRDDWPTLAGAERAGVAFAAKSGVVGSDAGAAERLRGLPPATLLGGLDLLSPEPDTYSGPMIDGRLVTTRASAGFAADRQARVPFLVGANSNELGMIPAPFLAPMTAALAKQLGADRDAVVRAYGSREAYDAHLTSDMTFVEPARFLAGQTAGRGQLTWLYSFGYVPTALRPGQTGAGHASELAFVFGNLDVLIKPATAEDEAAAVLVGDYWTAFAKTGDPNGPGRPAWPRYDAAHDQRLEITTTGRAAQGSAGGAPLDALRAHFAAANR